MQTTRTIFHKASLTLSLIITWLTACKKDNGAMPPLSSPNSPNITPVAKELSVKFSSATISLSNVDSAVVVSPIDLMKNKDWTTFYVSVSLEHETGRRVQSHYSVQQKSNTSNEQASISFSGTASGFKGAPLFPNLVPGVHANIFPRL
jgi:hypothetical protein